MHAGYAGYILRSANFGGYRLTRAAVLYAGFGTADLWSVFKRSTHATALQKIVKMAKKNFATDLLDFNVLRLDSRPLVFLFRLGIRRAEEGKES